MYVKVQNRVLYEALLALLKERKWTIHCNLTAFNTGQAVPAVVKLDNNKHASWQSTSFDEFDRHHGREQALSLEKDWYKIAKFVIESKTDLALIAPSGAVFILHSGGTLTYRCTTVSKEDVQFIIAEWNAFNIKE